MKKKILALAIAAISVVSFSAFAQKPCENSKCQNQKECTNKECTKNVCPKGNAAECCLAPAFGKMNLNDSQKEQVKALQQERMKSRSLTKQRCDSAGRAYRMAEKQNYLSSLKKIIGPDNYVIFLEEYYINGADKRPAKAAKATQGRPHKDHKDHKGSRR